MCVYTCEKAASCIYVPPLIRDTGFNLQAVGREIEKDATNTFIARVAVAPGCYMSPWLASELLAQFAFDRSGFPLFSEVG